MSVYGERIAEAALAVGFPREGKVTWRGDPVVVVPPRIRRLLDQPALRARVVDQLGAALYPRWYARSGADLPSTDRHDRPDPAFVAALSAANTGSGGWQPGWRVIRVGARRLTVRRGGLRVAVDADTCQDIAGGGAPRPERGDIVALPHPSELPRALPGFHLILGDVALSDGEPMVRLYWHLIAEGAPRIVGTLSALLNDERVPFQLKVADHPSGYDRRDAAVLYLPAAVMAPALLQVLKARTGLDRWLRTGAPAFTLSIARGLAIAEDPGDGASFGEQRCALVAEGLVRAHEMSASDVPGVVRIVLAEHGLDPERPYQQHLDLAALAQPASMAAQRVVPAPVLPASEGEALDTALGIGAAIMARTVWHGDACTWGERRPGSPYASLGPDLYGGTAGVAWFLAELAAETGQSEPARTACGALRHALWWVGPNRQPSLGDGLFTGVLGVALAADHVARRLGSGALRDEAEAVIRQRLAAWNTSALPDEIGFDLVDGWAGMVVGLLRLARSWAADDVLGAAVVVGRRLLAAATRADRGWSWPSPGIASSGDLTGLAHGAAGAAWALAELAAATGLAEFSDGASQAVAYERSLFDSRTGTWPDLRTGGAGAENTGPAASLWCHGATGIGISRLRMAELTGLPIYRDDAALARTAVRRDVHRALARTDPGWGLCHGLAGNADALLTLGNDSEDRSLVLRVVRVGRDRLDAWTGRDHPVSLMVGTSGIGLFHLRVARGAVSSPLLPVPC